MYTLGQLPRSATAKYSREGCTATAPIPRPSLPNTYCVVESRRSACAPRAAKCECVGRLGREPGCACAQPSAAAVPLARAQMRTHPAAARRCLQQTAGHCRKCTSSCPAWRSPIQTCGAARQASAAAPWAGPGAQRPSGRRRNPLAEHARAHRRPPARQKRPHRGRSSLRTRESRAGKAGRGSDRVWRSRRSVVATCAWFFERLPSVCHGDERTRCGTFAREFGFA